MKPEKISKRNIVFSEGMDDIYLLNTGLILGERYNYVIDTGLGSGSAAPVIEHLAMWKADAKGHGSESVFKSSSTQKPLIIINTHYHWDHVWGNFAFDANSSIVVAHERCRELIKEHWEDDLKRNASYIDGVVVMRLPDMVFTDSVYFPDDGVRVFFTPGHTEDCVSVFDEIDKVLYAGDNIGDTYDMIVPHIDTDVDTYKKTVNLYASLGFDVCISGHNSPQSPEVIGRILGRV